MLQDNYMNLMASYEELHKEHQKLIKIEDRYRLALEGANEGIWEWDFAQKGGLVLTHIKELLGFSADEVKNTWFFWLTLFHPQDIEYVIQGIKGHLDGKTSYYEGELRIRTKDGEFKWFLSRGKAVLNEEQVPVKMVGTYTDITERRLVEEKIRDLAFSDDLTGLLNRVAFKERLGKALYSAKERQKKAMLLYLDLDNFKSVNDTLGHEYGDILLKKIADQLKSCIREKDTVARLSGDEFALLVSDTDSMEEVQNIIKRIEKIFEEPYILCNQEFNITASIGIAVTPDDGQDEQSLIKSADVAMYYSKKSGKNCRTYYEQHMEEKVFMMANMKHDLKNTI